MGYSTYQGLGSGGDTGPGDLVEQIGHTFSGGEWVRVNGSQYSNALGDNDINAEVIGIVTEVIPGVSFRIKQSGRIKSLSALNPLCPYLPLSTGGKYFISETDAGQISLIKPSGLGTVDRPCLIADGPDSGWVLPYRGLVNKDDNSSGTDDHITQIDHNLTVGDVVFFDGDKFSLASASNGTQAEVVGIVKSVEDVNSFTLSLGGLINLSGSVYLPLVPGEVYFLSDKEDEQGQLTLDSPGYGSISKPLLIAKTATTGYFYNWRGILVTTAGGKESDAGGDDDDGDFPQWMVYNGVTEEVYDSKGISSVTKNKLGSYTVNFERPLPNTNYAVFLGADQSLGTGSDVRTIGTINGKTTNSVNISLEVAWASFGQWSRDSSTVELMIKF